MKQRAWPQLILASGLLVGALPAGAIVGGTDTSAFMNVGSGMGADGVTALANGIQISDNWVLTASHVGFGVGSTFTDGFGSASVAAVYNIGTQAFPADDLTLLRLDTAIGGAPALQLLSDVLPIGPLAQPMAVTITTGRNQSPRGYAYTELQQVLNQVDGGAGLVDVSWLVTYTGSGTAPYVQGGDSGGGLFLGNVTDSSVLMGIASASLGFIPSGFGSAFVQLASYQGWINTTMANDTFDAQLPNWVSAVPEPSSWALFAAGGGLLVGVASRRQPKRGRLTALCR